MQEIEYFYSAHSAFAYLGSSRFMQIAASGHYRIRHRPIFLHPVIDAAGGLTFQQRSTAHLDYYFRREIERWSELRKAPVVSGIPTHHRKDMTMANCLQSRRTRNTITSVSLPMHCLKRTGATMRIWQILRPLNDSARA